MHYDEARRAGRPRRHLLGAALARLAPAAAAAALGASLLARRGAAAEAGRAGEGKQDATVLLQTAVDLEPGGGAPGGANAPPPGATPPAAADDARTAAAANHARIFPPLQSESVFADDYPRDNQDVYADPMAAWPLAPGAAAGVAAEPVHDAAVDGPGLAEPAEHDSIGAPSRGEVEKPNEFAGDGAEEETPEQIAAHHVSFSSDWVGDSSLPNEHGEHGYLTLAWLLGCLLLGCLLSMVQARYLPEVPYTCLLLLSGFCMACAMALWYKHAREALQQLSGLPEPWPAWFVSVEQWKDAHPSVIFYVFLPVLIFGEAMKLNFSLARALSAQVMLLAYPGLLLVALPVAAFARYALPYGWSWPTSLVLGAALCATDPAAVVAVFGSLGVSQRLSTLVSCESLLTAGNSIILFALSLKVMLGARLDLVGGVLFFLNMTITPVLLGCSLAFLFLIVIAYCSESSYHSDAMIQVVFTICVAFVCFFLAETNFHTSGVLAVVSAGCIFSYVAWPRFVSREVVRIVWEALEYVANTVVFTLAGMLWGLRVFERWELLSAADFGWLLALYATSVVGRGLAVFLIWPAMNLVGQRLTWQECAAVSWAGLRGAVALVLAIVMDHQLTVDVRIGSQVMFHVGGVALLTACVNAATLPALLRALGLSRTPEIEEVVVRHLESITRESVKAHLQKIMESREDRRFVGANAETVMMLLPQMSTDEKPQLHSTIEFGVKVQVCREIFMQAVQARYWAAIDGGLIPRSSRPARVLVYSTQVAINNSDGCLRDWAVIEESLSQGRGSRYLPIMNRICQTWPLTYVPPLQQLFPSSPTIMTWQTYAAVSFLEAHKVALEELRHHFGADSVLGQQVQQRVAEESRLECAQAEAVVQSLPAHAVEVGKSRMLAGRLLESQLEETHRLTDRGILTEQGANEISRIIYLSKRKVAAVQRMLG